VLHFDGEFATGVDLGKGTFTGRNFGWLPTERPQAVAHIAHVVREDDGLGELAQQFGGAYRVVLEGTNPAIPPEFRLPPQFRIDVARASDQQILDAVATLVNAYVSSLVFAQTESGEFDGSPYDAFLRKNGLPRKPDPGESDLEYSRRLRKLVSGLARPQFVSRADGVLRLHSQGFVFGSRELRGLQIFLAEPATTPPAVDALGRGATGNCIACHPAPAFTDFSFHNTGAAQAEYDRVHGPGSFSALVIPDLAARQANFDAYLPASASHPLARGPFLDTPARATPGRTDLGLWNVFANPDIPGPQATLTDLLCPRPPCAAADLLPRTIALFKTPGLRDLGHSAPYLHTGQADSLEDVVLQYVRFSAMARAGNVRNASPPLAGIALAQNDVAALVAFLASLNEDYE
jgi:cytochrome c peroxidase